jgi:tRNA pseudouridine65 synthase
VLPYYFPVPEELTLCDIIYNDSDLVVIDKPAGTIIHTNRFTRAEKPLLTMLAGLLETEVYSVHRLDRGTSGVMVFARNPFAARALSRQFERSTVEKTYIALTRGHLNASVEIDHALTERGTGRAATASSRARPLENGVLPVPLGRYGETWLSLVEMELFTGRRHQARRHLHHLSHPVIGDTRYGDRDYNRYFARRFGNRLYLRSLGLAFRHPRTGLRLQASIGLPRSWAPVLTAAAMQVAEYTYRPGVVHLRLGGYPVHRI